METYLFINGGKAWISNKEDMEHAKQSAINVCDHSNEVIVRKITNFTDYREQNSEDLVRRFKMVALMVFSDDDLDFLSEKVSQTAEAIDSGFPEAIDMVELLEDFIIRVSEQD